MGKYDTCMREFLQNKERFADFFNGCCFQGEQVIRAEELQDASEIFPRKSQLQKEQIP